MKVQSVNIGKRKTIQWRGKSVETGIYKYPVDEIQLGFEDVVSDDVVDRRYHGGVDKAAYLYSADHYAFWKEKHPTLDWEDGMFGENVTVNELQERQVQIGDTYLLGSAYVRVTQPRQPCFKLGVRFGTQKVLKEFIQSGYSGIYVKLIEPGVVRPGDEMHLVERLHNSIGLLEVWDLLYSPEPDLELLEVALALPQLSEECKTDLRKRKK